jgi:hypothetical protein
MNLIPLWSTLRLLFNLLDIVCIMTMSTRSYEPCSFVLQICTMVLKTNMRNDAVFLPVQPMLSPHLYWDRSTTPYQSFDPSTIQINA